MSNLQKVSLESLSSALTTRSQALEMRLPVAELTALGIILAKLARRFPSQENEGTIEEYLEDYEALALKYSIQKVEAALAVLRIEPGRRYFPTPNEVAEEIERQQESRAAKDVQAEAAARKQADEEHWKRLMAPDEVTWRVHRFGYDPFTEKRK